MGLDWGSKLNTSTQCPLPSLCPASVLKYRNFRIWTWLQYGASQIRWTRSVQMILYPQMIHIFKVPGDLPLCSVQNVVEMHVICLSWPFSQKRQHPHNVSQNLMELNKWIFFCFCSKWCRTLLMSGSSEWALNLQKTNTGSSWSRFSLCLKKTEGDIEIQSLRKHEARQIFEHSQFYWIRSF